MPLPSKLRIGEIDLLHTIFSKLSSSKITEDKEYRNICACDVSYHEMKKGRLAVAAAITYNRESKKIVQEEIAVSKNPLPYVPSYFFVRELPPIVSVLRKMDSDIDVILVEGHGLLHPQKSGLAVYVGIFFDKPTIGVAKNLQVGKVVDRNQNISPIMYENKVMGNMIFPPNIGRRYYVSVGYKTTLQKATETVFALLTEGVDLIRMAHSLSKTLIS
ncbi:MAG: endonuclease V [Nitrososphaeria archaeon]